MTFQQARKLTDEQAREYLESLRWPNGPVCPHCGSTEATKLKGKATRPGVYKCKAKVCRKQFTVTIGTIFERSHIPLNHWIMTFALMSASKKGISAKQVERMTGCTYEAAWFMCHRIRAAMAQEPMKGLLSGTIESDETWIGGKARGKGQGHVENKVAVQALVQRGGPMRARAIGRVSVRNLRRSFDALVDKQASILMTDESSAYKLIGTPFTDHQSVNHSRSEYSRGACHVNTCESFFALLKRGVHGTFHHVGKQHLQRYCDEFAFRWNHRKVSDAERTESALRLAPGCRLMYKAS